MPSRETLKFNLSNLARLARRGALAARGRGVGGLRREINWDGVPDAQADPDPFPGEFFAGRGAVFTTPGTGFLVSAGAGQGAPPLFGFPSDFQAFSAQRLFTAVNSNVTDVHFVVPGTDAVATTSAFGVVFVDVEVGGLTRMEFFDRSDNLIFARDALIGGDQGLSFVGGVADAGERIARVRITSGLDTIVANGQLGNPNDDVVVMDDFLYVEPAAVAVPEPSSLAPAGLGMVGVVVGLRRRDSALVLGIDHFFR
ncbi:PEP-CTERM sorting domain-containing protein [Paludisphaera mucosa]|uniref:PEP-CTERM sorting domain-containing protein n=1 Tax=Paludisphaera mucosa TaxID=3030827 RepID=A0ABT6FIG3_9BACT|nr:PEP-CTERM sorting domain-containing protein [Paludisphaera mucosa]MDG3007365.1 PEP-CTERM sorting domain-containing protein [Paludisphaera mucosa]